MMVMAQLMLVKKSGGAKDKHFTFDQNTCQIGLKQGQLISEDLFFQHKLYTRNNGK